MVNVVTKTTLTPGQRMKERVDRMRKTNTRPGIRVEPANDDMRRVMAHPRAGHFRSQGSMVWPDDTFTYRRLRDGDIKRVEKDEKQDSEHKAGEHEHKAGEHEHNKGQRKSI